MFTFDQVQTAATAASLSLKAIKENYSGLKPYLVYASPYGQADIDARPAAILKDFPQMLVDSQAKTNAIGILEAIRKAEADKNPANAVSQLQPQLLAVLAQCRFKSDTNIEMRFGRLVYQQIRELKMEPWIDRDLTSPSDASIRLVLGTVHRLALPGDAALSHEFPVDFRGMS